jgi:hypothetical protein
VSSLEINKTKTITRRNRIQHGKVRSMGCSPAGSSAPLGEVDMRNTATGSSLVCILRVDQGKHRQLLRTKLIQLLATSSHHGLLPKAGMCDSVSYAWNRDDSNASVGSFNAEVNK